MKNFKEALAKPRTIALYAHLTIDDYTAIFEVHYRQYDEHYIPLPEGERREQPMEGWGRIGKPQEVTFTAIDDDSIVRNAVASLDEEERKLRASLHQKIVTLQERKRQLLALTYESAS